MIYYKIHKGKKIHFTMVNNEYNIKCFISIVNTACIIWNSISLLLDNVTTKTVGIIWVFNIGTGIILLERYFPEIKDKVAKIFLYLILGLGHLMAIILMFSERVSPNLVFCFIANIISFVFSLSYFIYKESR